MTRFYASNVNAIHEQSLGNSSQTTSHADVAGTPNALVKWQSEADDIADDDEKSACYQEA